MAEIDELLANAEEIDYLADDIQFLIDENLRTVTIPSDGVVLGVEGDKNSNRVNFQMPRYYNGFDMSEFTVRVNYVNANGDPGVYTVKDLEVRDDMILFTWLVDSDACAYVGVVRFLVRMTITNGSELIQAFDTTIAKANVLEGLPITNIVDEEDKYDIVLHLMGEVDEYIEKRVGNIDALEMVGKSTTGVEFADGGIGQNGAEIFNDYEKNVAVGSYSHAEGSETTASGNYAHAEGHQTTAFGVSSHAEGEDCYAEATMSHAEGWGSSTTGAGSHAEGFQSVASGNYSHAEGYEAKAENIASHAEGMNTTASGLYSHAEGNTTVTSGENSHAEGYYTKASSDNQHVQGKWNVEDTEEKYAFIIGNGDGEDNRSNALAIDWDGKIYVGDATEGVDVSDLGGGGVGQNTDGKTFENVIINGSKYDYTGTSTAEIFNNYANNIAAGSYSHAEGSNTRAVSTASHAEGSETTAKGYYSHAEGQATYATGNSSHAEGMSTKATNINAHAEGNATTASGKNSHAEGSNTTASEMNSHAEGGYTTAKGYYSHAEGSSTTASGGSSHAEGNYTKASGGCSHAEGYYTEATDDSSHAEGKWSIASAVASHAEGTSTKASSENQHTQGRYNVEDTDGKYAFIIGNGDANTRSNAIAIDWDGKIYVNNAEEGVDISVINTNISVLSADMSSLSDNISSINDGIADINSRMVGIRTDADGAEIFNYSLNEASGDYSHAEGYSTEALGRAAHAEGGDTIASGDYSHASGYHTTAASAYQTVIGQLNNTDSAGKYAFIIGNGYMEDLGTNAYAERRSTGFAIDWDGKIYVNGSDTGVDVSVIPSLIARIEALEAANGS